MRKLAKILGMAFASALLVCCFSFTAFAAAPEEYEFLGDCDGVYDFSGFQSCTRQEAEELADELKASVTGESYVIYDYDPVSEDYTELLFNENGVMSTNEGHSNWTEIWLEGDYESAYIVGSKGNKVEAPAGFAFEEISDVSEMSRLSSRGENLTLQQIVAIHFDCGVYKCGNYYFGENVGGEMLYKRMESGWLYVDEPITQVGADLNDGGAAILVDTEVFYTVTNTSTGVDQEVYGGYITIDKASAPENATVTVSATPAEGYVLNEVVITGTESFEDVTAAVGYDAATGTFTMPAYGVTVLAVFSPQIIEGANQTVDLKTAANATFRSAAPFDLFVKVMVDGKDLDAKYYEAKSGSTVVTLKQEYISGLSNGVHTISIVSLNGHADSTFTVTGQSSAPKTGDDNMLSLWIALIGVSAIGAFAVLKRRKAN